MEKSIEVVVMVLVFVLIGIGMIALGLRLRRRQDRFRTEGVRVQGIVTDIIERESPSGPDGFRTTYLVPVVAYRALDGREFNHEAVTYRAKEGISTTPALQPGQTVGVAYLPDAPERFDLVGDLTIKHGAYILIMMGALFVLTSAVVGFIAYTSV